MLLSEHNKTEWKLGVIMGFRCPASEEPPSERFQVTNHGDEDICVLFGRINHQSSSWEKKLSIKRPYLCGMFVIWQ